MVDPIGTSVSAFQAADLCINYGKILVQKYRAYRNAEREISELVLRVENHWIKFEYKLQFIQTVWPELDERLQIHQNLLVHTMQIKLQEANELLDGTIGAAEHRPSITNVAGKHGRVRKGLYALSLKDCLEKTLQDLEKWHGMFDPSWFLLTRVSNHRIDEELTKARVAVSNPAQTLKGLREAIHASQDNLDSGRSIWLPDNFVSNSWVQLTRSTLRMCQNREGTQLLLIDTIIPHPESQPASTRRAIRDLARVLAGSDPTIFGLLQCQGVIQKNVRDPMIASFDFVYSVPDGLSNPRSLRSVLSTNEDLYPLNERIDLAKILASSVVYVHSSRFVHKNIRPETIVVFDNNASPIGAVFLIGFENFRPEGGQTFLASDSLWEKDLYRHPTRQGLRPQEEYVMQHDIYSLGVTLLEIGLWTSFVIEFEGSTELTPAPELDIAGHLAERNPRKRAAGIKGSLIEAAERRLPSKMGQKYTNIVLSCLTCLDKIDNGFGNEDNFMDKDGISVGVRYIENILHRLQSISI